MTTGTQAPDQLFGCEVLDSAGNKLGSVDGVWVDDATNELEFVSVKTGWLMGKTHIIPTANAQVGDRTITIPYSEDQVKNAPSYGADAELSASDEEEIYGYYGMDRSTGPSPSGLASGNTGYTSTDAGYQRDAGSTEATDYQPSATEDLTTQDQVNVPVSEEQMQVGKRQVDAGQVRIRKVVRTEQVEQPIELRREDVEIERVPASGAEVPDTAFQEREIQVPLSREEPVVSKEAQVTGEVRVGKTAETEQRTVGGEIRKEEVEVDRNVDTESTDRRDRY